MFLLNTSSPLSVFPFLGNEQIPEPIGICNQEFKSERLHTDASLLNVKLLTLCYTQLFNVITLIVSFYQEFGRHFLFHVGTSIVDVEKYNL